MWILYIYTKKSQVKTQLLSPTWPLAGAHIPVGLSVSLVSAGASTSEIWTVGMVRGFRVVLRVANTQDRSV